MNTFFGFMFFSLAVVGIGMSLFLCISAMIQQPDQARRYLLLAFLQMVVAAVCYSSAIKNFKIAAKKKRKSV